VTGVSAVYFEGGGSSSHTITDLSLEGAQILTPISWGPGTLIRMSVRYEKGREVELVVDLWCRVVRSTPEALCVQFLCVDKKERVGFARFVERIVNDQYPSTVQARRLQHRAGAG